MKTHEQIEERLTEIETELARALVGLSYLTKDEEIALEDEWDALQWQLKEARNAKD